MSPQRSARVSPTRQVERGATMHVLPGPRQRRLQALGALAEGVAHDLNNLLALVLGHAEMLSVQLQGQPAAESASLVVRGVEEAATVVRRLQRLTRTRVATPMEAVEAEALLRDVLDLTRPRWATAPTPQRGQIGAEVCCEPDVPPLLGDPGELHELLTNLVFNAVEAMPTGGTLRLVARAVDDGVELSVVDTGIGMADEVQRRAFEPYFTTKGEAGTGLGLAIVKEIAQRHRGRVRLASAPHQGTTVSVWLPAAGARTIVPAGSARAEAPPADGKPLRVLAVEDEEPLARMLETLLEAAGHRVTVCLSGAEAVAHLERDATAFDVVLTDIGMPGVSGWEVARAARTQRADLPVVLLTGWGTALDDREWRSCGARAVLSKPYRRQHLLDTLRQVVDAQ